VEEERKKKKKKGVLGLTGAPFFKKLLIWLQKQ